MAPPASGSNSTSNFHFDSRPEDEHFEVNKKTGDDQYLKTFGVKLVAGRNFSPGTRSGNISSTRPWCGG